MIADVLSGIGYPFTPSASIQQRGRARRVPVRPSASPGLSFAVDRNRPVRAPSIPRHLNAWSASGTIYASRTPAHCCQRLQVANNASMASSRLAVSPVRGQVRSASVEDRGRIASTVGPRPAAERPGQQQPVAPDERRTEKDYIFPNGWLVHDLSFDESEPVLFSGLTSHRPCCAFCGLAFCSSAFIRLARLRRSSPTRGPSPRSFPARRLSIPNVSASIT